MRNLKAHKEDFPVSFFIGKKLRPLVEAYYQAARFADDIADTPRLAPEQKTAKLEAVRAAFMQPSAGNDLQLVRGLGRLFVSERLDSSLYLDLLDAFGQDAVNKPVRIWEELIEYCRRSAAPVGRFMLAIHDENPSTALPAENLCIILQLLNHLSDIKDDLSLLNRCYIPENLMREYGVRKTDLGLSVSRPEVKRLLSEMMARIDKMQADAALLPPLIKNFRLRLNTCVILSLTNSVIKRHIKSDILQNPPRPTKIDWAKACITGFFRALWGKTKQQRHIV